MKKFILLFILFFNINIVKAYSIDVTLNNCVDGDTAKFNYQGEVIKARFLAIDTPETVSTKTRVEAYGKEASNYTCKRLTGANNIRLEYDDNSNRQDKYDRDLVWVFVDNQLLQKELIEQGYAEVAYLYGDYKYTSELEKTQELAKKNKVGMWSGEEDNSSYYYIIGIVIIIIIIACLFSKKIRKKVIRKGKSSIKKQIKKELKKRI